METVISELSRVGLPPGGQFCYNGTLYLPNSCRVQTPTKPPAALFGDFLNSCYFVQAALCLLLTDTCKRRRTFGKCENCEGFWKNWAYF